MPQMGYDMSEGTVVHWLISEGAEVKLGEAVAEIETDKAVVECEATASGVLRRILISEGTTVAVGQPIAIIAGPDEELPDVAVEVLGATEPSIEKAVVSNLSQVQVEERSELAQEVRASPVARRLAKEKDIDLTQIVGTGPGSRIAKEDVLAFEESRSVVKDPVASSVIPVADGGERVPLSRMRQQIARVTLLSKQEVPHFYVSAEIDMGQVMEMRRQLNVRLEMEDMRVSVNDIIIKTCVEALKKYPKFNASFVGDAIQMNETINIGIAISEEEGLIVPALIDCDKKSLEELSVASKDLIVRSKTGTLLPKEYTGSTFSISNMGMFDVSDFTAIIHPPNSAMLAVGKAYKRPIVRDDQIVIAEIMKTTLSVDHRVADGAEGARFIGEVKRLLENPVNLLG